MDVQGINCGFNPTYCDLKFFSLLKFVVLNIPMVENLPYLPKKIAEHCRKIVNRNFPLKNFDRDDRRNSIGLSTTKRFHQQGVKG